MAAGVDECFGDIKAAMTQLHPARVLLGVNSLRRFVGQPQDAYEAIALFKALRSAYFMRMEMPSGNLRLAHARAKDALNELAELAHATGSRGELLLPPFARLWVLGQRLLLDRDFRAAYSALMPAVTSDVTARRTEELAALPTWTFEEKHDAKLIVDSTADLLRALREIRPPSGPISRPRAHLADSCVATVIERLSAHGSLSHWSGRRLLSRAAYELADRDERYRARELLHRAQRLLTESEANTKLASVDELLIKFELQLLDDEPNREEAQRTWNNALKHLSSLGFHRRVRDLKRMQHRIERHGRRADNL